jgi:hypothetical protein
MKFAAKVLGQGLHGAKVVTVVAGSYQQRTLLNMPGSTAKMVASVLFIACLVVKDGRPGNRFSVPGHLRHGFFRQRRRTYGESV